MIVCTCMNQDTKFRYINTIEYVDKFKQEK